jgi:hypothetical protein
MGASLFAFSALLATAKPRHKSGNRLYRDTTFLNPRFPAIVLTGIRGFAASPLHNLRRIVLFEGTVGNRGIGATRIVGFLYLVEI